MPMIIVMVMMVIMAMAREKCQVQNASGDTDLLTSPVKVSMPSEIFSQEVGIFFIHLPWLFF